MRGLLILLPRFTGLFRRVVHKATSRCAFSSHLYAKSCDTCRLAGFLSLSLFLSLYSIFSPLHHLFCSLNIILIAIILRRAMNTHAPPIPTGTPSKPPSLPLNQGVHMPLPSLPAQQPLPRSFSLSAPTHTLLASTTFMAALSGT